MKIYVLKEDMQLFIELGRRILHNIHYGVSIVNAIDSLIYRLNVAKGYVYCLIEYVHKITLDWYEGKIEGSVSFANYIKIHLNDPCLHKNIEANYLNDDCFIN